MKTFKLYNRILGWLVFFIAAFVYISTAEPSTSLWDCGEFIASAFKLQVGHPPGAPFFMILARVFTFFAGGNLENVAFMVNCLSAVASAFTILFLFWTITHLGLKITGREEIKPYQIVAVLGSGLVGALAYTFSDTFWFSAVEGEVYALSSFFTAIVFWAILKWENIADERYANRWLILIAYLMGLSIGVHLLNLLAIPAIVLVYYFRKYETTQKGVIYALLVSVGILGGVMYGVIPGVVWLASKFELLFVNGFGLPYNSGVMIYAVLLLGGLGFGIYYTHQHKKVILNTAMLVITVMLIGYSSYSMIVIRSLANPPMDENSPETVFLLQKYLNREQYGDRPLFSGQYFNAPVVDYIEGSPRWTRKDGKYIITSHKNSYAYDQKYTTVFPRMWSSDPNHVREYLSWGRVEERDVYKPRRNKETGQVQLGRDGKPVYDRSTPNKKPTMAQNIRFFLSYQIGHMYMRYFMWNFVGRQNNQQSHGELLKGKYISGINFFDKNFRDVGDIKDMPDDMKNDKSRNTYYFLPFLLGLIGFLFHALRHPKDFWVTLMLFVLTGLAIVIYLNQNPIQPRERDYAYAGSFYAFAIWIGLGVIAIIELVGKSFRNVPASYGVTAACLLLVPVLMASENWDDHDRSGRYTARDIAYDYLNSCAPNAILFTNGDNDTFPLWYIQEVEGVRTDVRVVNLMLLNMDWYIDQMNRKAYDSDRLPISVSRDKYIEGTNDVAFIQDRIDKPTNAKEIMAFFNSDAQGSKVRTNTGKSFDYIPARNFTLPVDSAKVVANGTVRPEDAHLIEKELVGKLKGSRLTKSDLIAFDIIAQNNWERPVYYVSTAHDAMFGLDQYLQLDGFAYRLVPIKTKDASSFEKGRINTTVLYDNLMNKFKYGRMYEDDVFLDNFHLRTLNIIRLRYRFNRLAQALIKEGDKERAKEVLDRCMEITPDKNIPYDMFMPSIIDTYYELGEMDKANEIIDVMYNRSVQNLDFYATFKMDKFDALSNDIQIELRTLMNLAALSRENEQTEVMDKITQKLTDYQQVFQMRF
ncbi:MAG: DUF2723 domain-containing protein [Bacteroidales bacterium]|nr:DUF2723 domain-containing protein [Bacteroidales bacterium]